jgi:hypothetical protein
MTKKRNPLRFGELTNERDKKPIVESPVLFTNQDTDPLNPKHKKKR